MFCKKNCAKICYGIKTVVLPYNNFILLHIVCYARKICRLNDSAVIEIDRVVQRRRAVFDFCLNLALHSVLQIEKFSNFVRNSRLALQGSHSIVLYNPNANIVNFIKHYCLICCFIDNQYTYTLFLCHLNRVKFKIGILAQKRTKPVFQLLISFFQGLEVIICSNNFVCFVINSPKQ